MVVLVKARKTSDGAKALSILAQLSSLQAPSINISDIRRLIAEADIDIKSYT